MQVPNIAAGMAASLGKQMSAEAKTAASTAATAVNSATTLSSSSAMRQIVAQYDMTDITPNDFSSMIQQLYAKGAVSPKDMQELSAIRADLQTAGVGADQSVNLEEFYQQQLAKAQANAQQSPDPVAANANVQAIATRMTWVQQFAAVRQMDNPSGVNAVA
jgi:hypothetical protein